MPIPKPTITCWECGFTLIELRKVMRLPCGVCGGRIFRSGESNVRYVLYENQITNSDKKFLKSLRINW